MRFARLVATVAVGGVVFRGARAEDRKEDVSLDTWPTQVVATATVTSPERERLSASTATVDGRPLVEMCVMDATRRGR